MARPTYGELARARAKEAREKTTARLQATKPAASPGSAGANRPKRTIPNTKPASKPVSQPQRGKTVKTPGLIDHPDVYMKRHPNAKLRILKSGDFKGMAVKVGGAEDRRRRAAHPAK